MASKSFSKEEWKTINRLLDKDPALYGFPERTYDTALLCSFNIRKLGSSRNRSKETWEFLARICRQFDLIAVQEILDDLSGITELMDLIGDEFGLVLSDRTGVFPGDRGVGERLGFVFRWSLVERGKVISDITFDRSKIIETIASNYHVFHSAMQPYAEKYEKYLAGQRNKPKNVNLPVFLSFIRQPYCVSFRIKGYPGTKPYEFMAVNAHLYFGNYIDDRRQEFFALMNWIMERFKTGENVYFPNFVLLGDLNLDYDNPKKDRARIEEIIKNYDKDGQEIIHPEVDINVNFPFLDVHYREKSVFKTNARLDETFDQIGLFFKDPEVGWPSYKDNAKLGTSASIADYGVFNFVNLFREALNIKKGVHQMNKSEKKAFYDKFQHKVSDHMPLWLRLPLPKK
ncbi:MAG: endonuclease/exonuclease/phosphatase [Bacteroidota bacterium]|nr:endonuclease/exonuclease/phosphatase [Bacteroidota bacterium]